MQYFALPPELMNIALNMNRKGTGRLKETSMAIARALAYKEPVDQGLTQEANVRVATGGNFERIVGEINSIIPVNTVEVRDLTKKWAAYRYEQVVGCIGVPYGREGLEVEDFFGYSKHFDTELLKSVRECPEVITKAVVDINRIICHICENLGNDKGIEVN